MAINKIMIKNQKYALISVYDKKDIIKICSCLKKFNIEIISTGSSAKKISQLGFKVKKISDLTKFKEILDGRVKTLHPNIHASLLYKRKNKSHIKDFKKLCFPNIDFIFVNLYPFEKAIINKTNMEECIEMIDIGGPTLLRSAAKNFAYVTAIGDINDYDLFIKNINTNKGVTSLEFRKKMAVKVFTKTSAYDKNISNWFEKYNKKNEKEKILKEIKLKYGENPNQKGIFIKDKKSISIFDKKIQGKDIGYNNIVDIEAGLNCIKEFSEPTCVIIKHNNPCGVASSKTINLAFKKAFDADSMSAFGGVVVLNRSVDKKLALSLSKNFFEVIVAKNFVNGSLLFLEKKNKLILISSKNLKVISDYESKTTIGGQLKQDVNNITIQKNKLRCMTEQKSNTKILEDLVFALKVAKHVKSNAIVLAKNKQTLGIGAGQMSRIDSTNIAIKKKLLNFKKIKFVAASDAFFPFTDNIMKLSKNNCTAIVQPFGSINDKKIIEYANKKKLPIYFTKFRLFKH